MRTILLSVMVFISFSIISCSNEPDSEIFEGKSNFVYDEQDRFSEETYKNALNTEKIQYIYDNNGNILEIKINGREGE